MARGMTSTGESIIHTSGITLRVDGSGNLNMTLYGINDVRSFVAMPLAMLDPDPIEPTRLVNFRSQRTMLEFVITEMDEYFEISRIILWMKVTATSYPGIR
jgi:hypothetical protein